MKNFRSLSYHLWLANKTTNWFGADSEPAFRYNTKNNSTLLADWSDTVIEYSFNEYGFRSDPFVEGKDIMFLGASNTLGTGLPLENTWVDITARELDSSYYNLGQGGGSSDTSFRLASFWIEALKPKLVIYLIPPSARLEVIDGFAKHDTFFKASPTGVSSTTGISDEPIEKAIQSYFNIWSSCDENIALNAEKNMLAISSICKSTNTKFVCLSTDQDWTQLDYARDLQHGGIKSNRAFADLVLSKC